MRDDRRIALVLGAGSSRHFDFPLGERLVTEICKQAEGIMSRIGECEAGAEESRAYRSRGRAFAEKLRRSGPAKSIDVFLGLHPSLQDTGKKLIAGVLLQCEDPGKLFDLDLPNASNRDPWYAEFWDWLLRRDLRDFGSESLSVITFNYDRSLEQYLHTAAGHMLDETDHKATELLSKLRIVHVHGQLGPLPFQSDDPVPYGGDRPRGTPLVPSILRAARDIKIISEQEDDSPELRKARSFLAEADTIIFLGFGFHPDNLRRLFYGYRPPWAVTLAATCLGYSPVKRDRLIETLLHHVGYREAKYVTDLDGTRELRLHDPSAFSIPCSNATVRQGKDGVLRVHPDGVDPFDAEASPPPRVVAFDLRESNISSFMHNSPYLL